MEETNEKDVILIIDDEDIVRRVIAVAIQNKLGNVEVIEAASGAEAMQTAQNRGDISLAIVDYKLPDGSGVELANKLSSKLPGAKILLITGCDPGSITTNGHACLGKPIYCPADRGGNKGFNGQLMSSSTTKADVPPHRLFSLLKYDFT